MGSGSPTASTYVYGTDNDRLATIKAGGVTQRTFAYGANGAAAVAVAGVAVLIVGCAITPACRDAVSNAISDAAGGSRAKRVTDQCPPDDGNDSCDKVLDKGQLKSAGIYGRARG